jgi:hypothetical protein
MKMRDPFRIVLADDRALFREGIKIGLAPVES